MTQSESGGSRSSCPAGRAGPQEAELDFLSTDTPLLTKTRSGTKKGAGAGWKDPENLLTADEAWQWIENGGNVGVGLGLDMGGGSKLVVIDVEEEGALPGTVELIEEYAQAVWESPHGGLNRLVAATPGAYALLDDVKTKVDLDNDSEYELELLTDGHSLIPPSVVEHRDCRDSKDGCPGEGKGWYRLVDTNHDADAMTEDIARELLDQLDLDPDEGQVTDSDGSDGDYELPDVDESLADVGEAILEELQTKSIQAFNSLMGLLQGGTGGYDDRLLDGGRIDRSLQEVKVLTRLHEAIVYLGKEEDKRAEAITRSTFERYVSEHRTTDDGQVRKWLVRGEAYRKAQLGAAVDDCDHGKFNRFLNRDPRDEDRWRSWTGDYSDVTYEVVRFALDLLTGKLDPFFKNADDLRDTAANFYRLDLDEHGLRELLEPSPPPVQGTTPNSRALQGDSGYVSPADYPSPSEVAEIARLLDEQENSQDSYEEALRRLRGEGLVKLARVGRQYAVYPELLSDPPDACYVQCNGEKYEPDESPDTGTAGEEDGETRAVTGRGEEQPSNTLDEGSPDNEQEDAPLENDRTNEVQNQPHPEQRREQCEHQQREAAPHIAKRRQRSKIEARQERLNQP